MLITVLGIVLVALLGWCLLESWETPVAAWQASTNDIDLVVRIKLGLVKGRWSGEYSLVREFVGIPYGASTAGCNRFRPAQPAESLGKGVFLATSDQPPCPQIEAGIFTNEDCLKLSIYSPKTSRIKNRKLPVVFWIFGGAFAVGGAWMNGLYSGAHIVHQTDVVFVTFNYRVGALGFLCTSGPNGFSGNAGITDQILAFQWVRENIDAFGGDPNNITIQGQSAGALSAMILLQYPVVGQHVRRAIIMSCPFALRFKPVEEARAIGDDLVRKLGCEPGDMTCIQSIPASKILLNQTLISDIFAPGVRSQADALVHMPVLDFDIIHSQPADWISGKTQFPNIPIIFGSVEDEASLLSHCMLPFSYIFGLPISAFSALGYRSFVTRVWKDKADLVLQRYPPTNSILDNWNLFLSIITHYMFVCPTRQIAKTFSKHNPNVHLYRWSYPGQYMRYSVGSKFVAHAAELPIIFGNIPSFAQSYLLLFFSKTKTSAFEEYLKVQISENGDPSGKAVDNQLCLSCDTQSSTLNATTNILHSSKKVVVHILKSCVRNTVKTLEQSIAFLKFSFYDIQFHNRYVVLLSLFLKDKVKLDWPSVNHRMTYLRFILEKHSLERLENINNDDLCDICNFWTTLDVYGQY